MSNYPIAVPQHLKANRPKFIVKISSWILNIRKWEIDGVIPDDKRVVLVIGLNMATELIATISTSVKINLINVTLMLTV